LTKFKTTKAQELIIVGKIIQEKNLCKT
jgi:hypothetical protein